MQSAALEASVLCGWVVEVRDELGTEVEIRNFKCVGGWSSLPFFFPFLPLFLNFFVPFSATPSICEGGSAEARCPLGLSETCPQGDAGGNAETPERVSTPGEL